MRWLTLLFAHAIASWVTFGVAWAHTLAQPNRPPLNGEFWQVFLVTEGAAPVWLPVSLCIYRPALTDEVLGMAGVYLLSALITWWLLFRLARRRLERRRVAAGLCGRCGYDIRATPQRCPECGQTVTPAPIAAAR